MRLEKVRIQNLRCIEDTDEFNIADVTCLVGKNESGKTTVLQGLYKLNPDNKAAANFDPLDDYPRHRYSNYKAKHAKETDPVLTTTWKLDHVDVECLSKEIGEGARRIDSVQIHKGYYNLLRVF